MLLVCGRGASFFLEGYEMEILVHLRLLASIVPVPACLFYLLAPLNQLQHGLVSILLLTDTALQQLPQRKSLDDLSISFLGGFYSGLQWFHTETEVSHDLTAPRNFRRPLPFQGPLEIWCRFIKQHISKVKIISSINLAASFPCWSNSFNVSNAVAIF